MHIAALRETDSEIGKKGMRGGLNHIRRMWFSSWHGWRFKHGCLLRKEEFQEFCVLLQVFIEGLCSNFNSLKKSIVFQGDLVKIPLLSFKGTHFHWHITACQQTSAVTERVQADFKPKNSNLSKLTVITVIFVTFSAIISISPVTQLNYNRLVALIFNIFPCFSTFVMDFKAFRTSTMKSSLDPELNAPHRRVDALKTVNSWINSM